MAIKCVVYYVSILLLGSFITFHYFVLSLCCYFFIAGAIINKYETKQRTDKVEKNEFEIDEQQEYVAEVLCKNVWCLCYVNYSLKMIKIKP